MIKPIFAYFVLLCLFFNTAFASDAGVLEALEGFYQASIDEDVEAYIAAQDQNFLELIGEDINLETYFKAAFQVIDTTSFELIAPEIIYQQGSALVFFRLKAEFTVTETKERALIDNHMVAFLWQYPEGWKVRWVVTRTLYEEKLVFGLLSDAALESAFLELEPETVLQEMKSLGLAEEQEDKELTYAQGKISKGWIVFAAILAILGIFLYKRKKDLMPDISRKKSCHKRSKNR
jgi:hypothetical protein